MIKNLTILDRFSNHIKGLCLIFREGFTQSGLQGRSHHLLMLLTVEEDLTADPSGLSEKVVIL
jgi:hypothetical protein